MRLSEDDLIAHYLAPWAGPGAFGLGDDAAVVTPRPGHDLVVSKDMLVAGVHFFADDPADAIARKALRVNLSDLAAKGAVPTGFLLGLALPTDWTETWLAAFVAGLREDAARFEIALLGGDTVAIPGPLTLSLTVFGEVEAGCMVRRGGTRVGDRLYVSGTIGDAALGLQIRCDARVDAAWLVALDEASASALRGRHLTPEPRIPLRDALRHHAHAAMDVSDGLVGDLAKMLRLEGLGATIAAAEIPLSPAARQALQLEPGLLQAILTGGDDYEILCAVAPDAAAAFERAAALTGIAVAHIGTAMAGDGVRVLDETGIALGFTRAGFQHFV